MTNPLAVYPLRSVEYVKLADMHDKNRTKSHFLTPNVWHGDQHEMEKNWLMINNGTNLFAIYALKPFILAQVEKSGQLRARVERYYTCLNDIRNNIHISSNAVQINVDGKSLYAFIFNQKQQYPSIVYKFYMGFIEAKAPFKLLKRTNEISINITAREFYYISSITVKDSHKLVANKDDILILSGGVDDESIFRQEFYVKDLLHKPTVQCIDEMSEYDFMLEQRPLAGERFFLVFPTIMIVMSVGLLFVLLRFYKRNKSVYRHEIISKSA